MRQITPTAVLHNKIDIFVIPLKKVKKALFLSNINSCVKHDIDLMIVFYSVVCSKLVFEI